MVPLNPNFGVQLDRVFLLSQFLGFEFFLIRFIAWTQNLMYLYFLSHIKSYIFLFVHKFTCVCIRRTSSNVFHTGTYIDKKCPFTGNVSIRGRIIAGTCHSAKMNRTIIVRRNYLHFIKKYQRYSTLSYYCEQFWYICVPQLCKDYLLWLFVTRYEKRHSNIPAHVSPCFRVKEGDHVTIGQCRLDLCWKTKFIFSLFKNN